MLKVCPVCHRYKSIMESGTCELCSKGKFINILIKANGSDSTPYLSSGKILSKERWFSIRRQVDRFYEATAFEDIDRYNFDISNKVQGASAVEEGAGYIYLLRSDNGYYKIGKTVDIDKRVKEITREYPVFIQRIHYFKTGQMTKVESFLHKLFSEFKLQGEWFRLQKGHLDYILSFNSGESYSLSDVVGKVKM